MAQRIVVIVNGRLIQRAPASSASSAARIKLGVIEVITADAYLGIDKSLSGGRGLCERAEGCSCCELFFVEDDVLNEVRLVQIAELELNDRSIQFIDHRLEDRIRRYRR